MANYRKTSAIKTTSGATAAIAIQIDPDTGLAVQDADWFTLPFIVDSSVTNNVADVTFAGEDDAAIILGGTTTRSFTVTFGQQDAGTKNLAYDLAGNHYRIFKLSHTVTIGDKWQWVLVGDATFSQNVTHAAKGGTSQFTMNINNNASELNWIEIPDGTLSEDSILLSAGCPGAAVDSLEAAQGTPADLKIPAARGFIFLETAEVV